MDIRRKRQLVWDGGLIGAVQSQNLASQEIS